MELSRTLLRSFGIVAAAIFLAAGWLIWRSAAGLGPEAPRALFRSSPEAR